MSKTKEIANVMTEEQLALLRDSYPVEKGFTRILLPRLGLVSQDVVEGKGKSMKVVTEAGTFFTESQTDEVNEEGKKVWDRQEIGTSIQGTILFQRKQLRFYDSANQSYTSSPIYDNDDQVVPLFANKAEVAKGTPKELQARPEFQGLSAKGKPISKLEEQRVLYVLYKDTVFQMTVRGTSMFAFLTYVRGNLPPSVLTEFDSEEKQNGSISWSQMTFETVRQLDSKEATVVQEKMNEIRTAVEAEKNFYKSADTKADKELDALAGEVAF